MNENKKDVISNEAAYEILVAAMERQVKRLYLLCIIIFIALIGSNLAWIMYENSFQDMSTSVTQEISSDGDAVLNGDGAGAIYYDKNKADSNN